MNFEVSKSRGDREIKSNDGAKNEANEKVAGTPAAAGNQACYFRSI